ncbi:MAG: hypothetical protein WC341_15375 [Bacteroidales bacterium]|jgi:hypothetical protein
MKIELKNVKINSQLSEETACFSATLYIDGKKAGTASNRGCGGSNEIHIFDPKLRDEFNAFCKAQPLPKGWGDLPMDADLYISLLLEKLEETQQLKRWCKKSTMFRLKGDKKGEWRTVKHVFNAEVKAFLVGKYGDTIETIANEHLGE